jgi:hypothetical protein
LQQWFVYAALQPPLLHGALLLLLLLLLFALLAGAAAAYRSTSFGTHFCDVVCTSTQSHSIAGSP